MSKWNLDPKDVAVFNSGVHTKQKGHPDKTRGAPLVTLVHIPTGIQVKRVAPWCQYSKPRAREIREAFYEELLPELEMKVARFLHISGR